jgi:tetratricopeptide (TPR) repeat protein
MSESNFLGLIKTMMAQGDFQAAEEALRVRLRTLPVPIGINMLLIDVLIRTGKFSDATQFVNDHRDDPSIFVRLRDYFIGERMNEAASHLISAYMPNDPGIAHTNDSILKQLSGDLSAAVAASHNAIRFNGSDASAHNQLGRVLFNARQIQESQSAFEKAATLNPAFAEAWHNLGHVLRAQNKLEAAEKAYARSIELAPNYRSGLLNLGIVQISRGKNSEALENFHQLIGIDPDNSEAQLNAGITEHILRNIAQAKLHYQKAISLDSKNAMSLRHLGNLFAEELNTEAAADCFRKSLAINPHMGDVWAELIELYERNNRLDEAQKILAEANRALVNDANVQYLAAKIARRENKPEQSIAIFKGIDPRQLHPRFFQAMHFEFASTLDRAGEYTQAFQNFEKANQLASQSIRAKQTDFSALDRHMDAVEEWLSTGAKVEEYQASEDLGADLCFLLGFPRSGTTLLDVMLDGHPQTQTLEERATFERVAFAIDKEFGGYPFGMSAINSDQRESLRKQYRALLEKEGVVLNRAGIIVDKMPIRTIDAACIHRLFPRAKFIFALRHPCDVILSNYMQNFAANEAFVHFNTLAESCRVYERVMRIWKNTHSLMPVPVHFVRYEQLVSETDRTLQEACRFLELPWVDNMGAHQATLKDRSQINTNSYHQVAEPVYTRAIGRWKNYRLQLDPYLAKIKPYADYFSYSLD